MIRYRSNIRAAIVHDLDRWGYAPELGIEAHPHNGEAVRIELDRSEALKLRRLLSLYIKSTAKPRRR